jgi:opacity protein-like surface antigen
MSLRALLAAMLLSAGAVRARAADAVPPAASPPALPGGVARAAPPERRRLVSLGLGLIEPVSKVYLRSIGGGAADNGDLGAQLSAQYVYFLTPRVGAGLEVDYSNRSGTLSTRLYPAADASVSGDTWLMLAIMRCALTDRGSARPFILLGAGGAWNKTTVDVRPSVWADTTTHETRRLVDDSAWVPAASVRLGLDIDADALSPGLVTLEAGWTGLAGARYAATPRGEALGLRNVSGPLNILTFTARYGWRF